MFANPNSSERLRPLLDQVSALLVAPVARALPEGVDRLWIVPAQALHYIPFQALLLPDGERTAIACTKVAFRVFDEALLDWYLATGEWRGRAGGYAIQGAGAALVRKVEGDYENVVGLPLAVLLDIYPELLFACK